MRKRLNRSGTVLPYLKIICFLRPIINFSCICLKNSLKFFGPIWKKNCPLCLGSILAILTSQDFVKRYKVLTFCNQWLSPYRHKMKVKNNGLSPNKSQNWRFCLGIQDKYFIKWIQQNRYSRKVLSSTISINSCKKHLMLV